MSNMTRRLLYVLCFFVGGLIGSWSVLAWGGPDEFAAWDKAPDLAQLLEAEPPGDDPGQVPAVPDREPDMLAVIAVCEKDGDEFGVYKKIYMDETGSGMVTFGIIHKGGNEDPPVAIVVYENGAFARAYFHGEHFAAPKDIRDKYPEPCSIIEKK